MKRDKALDDIVQTLVDNISQNSQLKEHLPYFNIKAGVVKKETDVFVIREISAYPAIEVETSKAVCYSIRSNGLKRSNGRPVFYDTIKIKGSDGKDARIKGSHGDVINFLERLYIAIMVLFKPDVLVKTRGLKETDSKHQAAMQVLEEYNKILETVREISPKKLGNHEVTYYEVHGKDLLKKIEESF